MFMATIVYPVAAFTSGFNVFKRDGRLWKTMNVRAGQEMLWSKKTRKLCVNSFRSRAVIIAEIYGIGIRNIRSVDLSYFDRKFGVHKGLCQICSAHFKTTRKRPQNFGLFDQNSHCNHQPFTVFAWYGTLQLLLVRKTSFGNERKTLCWRWCYSKGYDRHTQCHTEGWPKEVFLKKINYIFFIKSWNF